jgi:hypothetical protein
MSKAQVAIQVRLVSRREILEGGVTVAGACAIAGCDELVLPSGGVYGEEIPPVTANDDFYVTSCCGTPAVDTATWRLSIRFRGQELASLDLAYLQSLSARDKEHTLQCIGSNPSNQAISNAVWAGLPFVEILAALGIEAPESAVELKVTGADEYATALPIGDLDKPLWLVWRMNGVALPDDHGKPARLLNPGRYGTKNPKWVTTMEFLEESFVGYWESQGWSNTAEYQANGFIAEPFDGGTVAPGDILLLGTAFAGPDPVVRVEISVDGGATWTDAEITYGAVVDIWTLWRFTWRVDAPGAYEIQVRAHTEGGASSEPDPDGTNPLDGYDGSMKITVSVQ